MARTTQTELAVNATEGAGDERSRARLVAVGGILGAAVGLSALTGYLDYVLLPALALCIALIGYGLYRQRQARTVAVSKTTTRT